MKFLMIHVIRRHLGSNSEIDVGICWNMLAYGGIWWNNGGMWSHMVAYDCIWWHMVAYDDTWQ